MLKLPGFNYIFFIFNIRIYLMKIVAILNGGKNENSSQAFVDQLNVDRL